VHKYALRQGKPGYLFMKTPIKVGIAGIQGYVGQELMALLQQHPSLSLCAILAKKSQAELYDEMPGIAAQKIPVYSLDEIKQQPLDLLLLATPPEVSMDLISQLAKSSFKIIDLSGAFRISANEFTAWYGVEHRAPELINHAHYGLSPWSMKNPSTLLVSNPGCYATAALMPLIPLIKHGVIKTDNIIMDAKSGVSGAGKKINSDLMFNEMQQNFFPYKIGKHQHIPEIEKAIKQFTNETCEFTLTTHMLPISRGISMSIYADAKGSSDQEITDLIESAYQLEFEHYPLCFFGEINQGNFKKDKFLLSLKSVVGTAKNHIAYYVNNKKVFIFSSLDNLLKGAASQAIENINALWNFPLETGLLKKEGGL
jgi:N-acetyl-gamma-glutamyl-phosphate reductase